jgi:hypothetical protein
MLLLKMPFYKKQGKTLLTRDSVTITLTKDDKDKHIFPVDGWYWFESEQAAKQLDEAYQAMIKETFDRC